MARWIHVTKAPFDYRWPDVMAITAFTETGDHFVKDEIADFAVDKGYASEGKADKRSRSVKGKRDKGAATAKAADIGPAARVDNAGAAVDDRAADRLPVDHDSGER